MPQLERFLRLYGNDIKDQIRHRRTNDPRSTGAVEAMLGRLDTAFPRRRANRLANLYRTTNLFRLISAAQRGVVDEVEWAVRIRKFVESHDGHMPLNQRPHDDRRGHPSLHC